MIELTASNFAQEVLGAPDPVLVQFWAGWSEPSRAMMPLLESVADGHGVAVRVGRVNVEQNEELTEQCGVRCVPTVLMFSQGSMQDQIVGRATEQDLLELLVRFK